uniref:Putative P0 n=1 Tax=Suaeda polerovirus A TaxID=2593980 RepID=A0A7G3W8M8_9VIRU|nr:putative P0 [Suaeda polerovirus A]
MQFELTTTSLTFHPTRILTTIERTKIIGLFLETYNEIFLNCDENFIRNFLARLPLLISEQLSGDYKYIPGRRKRVKLARHFARCGAPLSSANSIDLQMPPGEDSARLLFTRDATRNLGEGILKRQTCLYYGKDEFDKFLSVWLNHHQRELEALTPLRIEIHKLCLELLSLGFGLRDLVSVAGIYNRDAYNDISLSVYRIYGEVGGLDFWRLANFPAFLWTYNFERHFEGSVVQKELQRGDVC